MVNSHIVDARSASIGFDLLPSLRHVGTIEYPLKQVITWVGRFHAGRTPSNSSDR